MKKVPVEVYSRVSGYYRPVHQWNQGKKSEFTERVNLKLDWLKNDEQRTEDDR